MDKFVAELIAAETAMVTDVMAFMSYNPSIGRVLEEGGVSKFQKLIAKILPGLTAIQSGSEFDTFHSRCVSAVLRTFKTSRGGKPSYGQAQKPINVFFKVYVDWARKPDDPTRGRLLPFLHVPLDSILMRTIKGTYPSWYKAEVRPHVEIPQQEFSLSKIDKTLYMKWQSFFRSQYPEKPLIFDVAWAMNRRGWNKKVSLRRTAARSPKLTFKVRHRAKTPFSVKLHGPAS